MLCVWLSLTVTYSESDTGSGRSDGWQDPQRILETGPRSHLGPSSLFTISSQRPSSLCILRGCSLKTAISAAPCVVDGGVRPDSGAGHSRLAGLAQGGPLPSEAGGGRRQLGIFLLPWLPLVSGFCVTT